MAANAIELQQRTDLSFTRLSLNFGKTFFHARPLKCNRAS